jgi:hypothetical protein
MASIETNEFELTKSEYFKIVSLNRLRRYWWLYLTCFIFAFFHVPDFGRTEFSSFIVIFGFFYPMFLFVYLYFWTTSKKNRVVFLKRSYMIDDKKFTAKMEDGSTSEIPWNYVLHATERNNYWLFYIAKEQFLYFPKYAFKTKDDLDKFENILKNNTNFTD